MFHLKWKDDERSVGSVEEAIELVESLHAQFKGVNHPSIITVRNDAGDIMTIGLGAERSFLNFMSEHLKPPYYSTVGENENEQTTTMFDFMGEQTEVRSRNLISLAGAVEALKVFCNTGQRDSSRSWEID